MSYEVIWQSIEKPIFENLPLKSGFYLVGNKDNHKVGQARYIAKKKEWRFPSAKMAFEVQVWTDMPTI